MEKPGTLSVKISLEGSDKLRDLLEKAQEYSAALESTLQEIREFELHININ